MKILLKGLVLIALANLIALMAFTGWLVSSDRLNMDRIRAARSALAVTITEERAMAAQALVKQETDAKAAAEAAKAAKPPMTASEQLSARLEATELDRERAARLRREVETLQRTLAQQADRLAADRAAFDAERKSFALEVAASSKQGTDEKFDRALSVLSALKPAAAKAVLLEVMRKPTPNSESTLSNAQAMAGATADITAELTSPQGDGEPTATGIREAVTYLEAMEDRIRSKIMTEIAKDDPALAAKLLGLMRGDPSSPMAQAPSGA
jgi:hypothetical protein